MDTIKETKVPISSRSHSVPENMPTLIKYLMSFNPLAPAMTGMARKNENSLAT